MFFILDRDGVINVDSDAFIKSPTEWLPIPGSLEAIAKLKQAGHTVIVATNQSGVGRGYYSLDTLNAIHAKMEQMLSEHGAQFDGIYFCPHTPTDECECRKPKPGLLNQIAADFKVDLKDAHVIGDSLRDLQAGLAVGANVILVKTGKGERTLAENPSLAADVYPDLQTAVDTFFKTRID